jgi:ADP-heptose:LPS heptosyltransferase
MVKALGGGDQPLRFHVPIQPEAREWARGILNQLPRPWLVFGVGARWPTKQWPTHHFAALAERAWRRFGGTALFIGGAAEMRRAQDVAERLRGPVCDLTGRTSLPKLAALLRLADVMVANDSGPTHLAAALGRPVVVPYTCTRVQLHGPYGQPSRGVETTVWCRGSYVRTCSRLECMNELTPDRLWPVLEEVLSAWQRNPQCA